MKARRCRDVAEAVATQRVALAAVPAPNLDPHSRPADHRRDDEVRIYGVIPDSVGALPPQGVHLRAAGNLPAKRLPVVTLPGGDLPLAEQARRLLEIGAAQNCT
eukprot:CAMPEP_0182509850 /NCGR_PEP_ID=MMETSP1321-20130603/27578_1 /TAXON_ID=91990 /ORGANISM="Bolidomonas sp., Strain RCC1657" /LENGTH=103 /DNA_ID=CAMNT_0024716217 /DNA_START=255 /DNA_END=566 /DNA_ORIENTATION=+